MRLARALLINALTIASSLCPTIARADDPCARQAEMLARAKKMETPQPPVEYYESRLRYCREELENRARESREAVERQKQETAAAARRAADKQNHQDEEAARAALRAEQKRRVAIIDAA